MEAVIAAETPRRRPRWRADSRTVRLASGLVLFTYVTLHLTNHALGNIGLAWMERGLLIHKFVWQGPIGTAVLYSALAVHFVLGLAALYTRRRLNWTFEEVLQLVLGLCVPPLLANHLAATRIAFAEFGLNKGYAQELYSFWIASPGFGRIQLLLLVVAWTHGCIGLHLVLRLRPWYPMWRSWLLMGAVLLPMLALLGYLQGGREVMALAQDPTWRAATTAQAITGTPPENAWLADVRNSFLVFDGSAIAFVLLARLVRSIRERRAGRVRVTFAEGRRQWVPRGYSVLEASHLAGLPHASLCGGRGRCTLCRVRVLGGGPQPRPEPRERVVLERLGVDPTTVRLACQLRPRTDVAVLPLVPPAAQMAFLHRRQQLIAPEERFVALLFVDMRDSTELASSRLPYDSVFILGRFISAVCAAVVAAGGIPNQFLGDGVLAIFGLREDARTACTGSVRAVAGVAANVRRLNDLLQAELHRPIRFAAGLHCGRAVVGEIGFRDHVTFTALGYPANLAARLQDLAKELEQEAVISEDVLRTSGLTIERLPSRRTTVRGRFDEIAVRLVEDAYRDLPIASAADVMGRTS
jgi:adenylate cyclase